MADSSVRTHTVSVPARLADLVVALCHHAILTDTEDALAEALDVLHATVTTVPPDGTRSISPTLVTRAALKPLLERVKNLESPLEEECLGVLADAGVALDFRNGQSLMVRYFDRLTGSAAGQTTPDFFHPWTGVAIYCDSARHHSSAEAQARDNLVNVACYLRGYTPVRLTTDQIRAQPKVVASVVNACLRRERRGNMASGRSEAA
jgi:hypothetical protein